MIESSMEDFMQAMQIEDQKEPTLEELMIPMNLPMNSTSGKLLNGIIVCTLSEFCNSADLPIPPYHFANIHILAVPEAFKTNWEHTDMGPERARQVHHFHSEITLIFPHVIAILSKLAWLL